MRGLSASLEYQRSRALTHVDELQQIDDRWHAFARSAAAMNPTANADYAAGMIAGLLSRYGGNVHKAGQLAFWAGFREWARFNEWDAVVDYGRDESEMTKKMMELFTPQEQESFRRQRMLCVDDIPLDIA